MSTRQQRQGALREIVMLLVGFTHNEAMDMLCRAYIATSRMAGTPTDEIVERVQKMLRKKDQPRSLQ